MNISNLFDSKDFKSDCKKVPSTQIKSLLGKLKLNTKGTKDELCEKLNAIYNIPEEEFIDQLYITQYKEGACEKYSTKELLSIAKERNMSAPIGRGAK